ncbi:MAG: hypothetical protein ACOC5U_04460 [Candidatus Aminicenantaceae bacterium]
MNKSREQRDFLFYSLKSREFIPQRCPSLDNLKREYLQYLLRLTRHNHHETAAILGMSPDSLKELLKEFGLL